MEEENSSQQESVQREILQDSQFSPWKERRRIFLKWLVPSVLTLFLVWGGIVLQAFFLADLPPKTIDPAREMPRDGVSGDDSPHIIELLPPDEYSTTVFRNRAPIDRDRLKRAGCIADGLLSGWGGDTNDAVEMVQRSECYYLHRAIETWLEAPNFDEILETMDDIDSKRGNIVYGMFIAEAIDRKEEYFYPVEGREFDFGEMCRPGTKNFWGEHTCHPYLGREEYRKYLYYITEQAMDRGVQVFMFGQVFYQDHPDRSKTFLPEVIEHMREYAAFRNIDIMIGAQTNSIEDEEYLRMFDFIEGGVGVSSRGQVENGPCFSRWWKKPGDWCWALLWNNRYKEKANDVFVHFDWSGKYGDDMSTFARMSDQTRLQTLYRLHTYFTARDVAFFLPLQAPLPKNNGGCHGASSRFYSASEEYSCADEDTINTILSQ